MKICIYFYLILYTTFTQLQMTIHDDTTRSTASALQHQVKTERARVAELDTVDERARDNKIFNLDLMRILII